MIYANESINEGEMSDLEVLSPEKLHTPRLQGNISPLDTERQDEESDVRSTKMLIRKKKTKKKL